MGNRVNTEITVKKSQASKALKTLVKFGHIYHAPFTEVKEDDDAYYEIDGGLCVFVLGDINFADVREETEALLSQGIAHNVRWDEGCAIEAGRNYFRFDADGEIIRMLDIPDDEEVSIDAIEVLKMVRTRSKQEVIEYLEEHVEEYAEPSWKKQIEYGKIHVSKLAQSNAGVENNA